MKHRKPAPAWHRLGLKISKKVVVGITAAATAFGGLAIASTAAQASTDRDRITSEFLRTFGFVLR